MSLILDALKKAEQDRHAGQAPVIDEMLVRNRPMIVRRHQRQQDAAIAAAMAVALLFAVAGLVYWFWPASDSPAPVATPAAPIAAAQAPDALEPPTAPLRIDPERLEAPLPDAPEEGVAMGDTGAAQAMTMDELDGDTPQHSPSKPPASAGTSSALATETQARPAPVAEPPAPVMAATSSPAPVVQPPPSVEPPAVRALKDMPPAFRSEFPKLTVDVHVYNDNPLRRFALINGKKYRETDTLMDGPKVVEITPSGVILEHRGSKVLLELPR
ncbi:MAG: general secretion pathway protein GspB [Pseudomonadota bacterium]